MALLKVSRTDITKWLEGQKIKKPLQDMTQTEIKRAAETFKIPREVLLQIINATEYEAKVVPTPVVQNKLQGTMNQIPNPQRGIYDGEN